ncbi:probable G-protein coupled receptor 141 [Osmerus eperlanus]|uniref:probable G-protein coupled receptor 141 n=1 Tax=Osmerus eperlanus TaxID=29151 RepID=UPI002E0FEEB9
MEYISANNTTIPTVTLSTMVKPFAKCGHRQALTVIYSTIMLLGGVGGILMVRTFKSSKSVITIAVMNLTIAHSLFLLTVPFRLHYYAVGTWEMGLQACNAVSGMIHCHMYLSFVFYTVIIVLRIWSHYGKENNARFYRNMHAFLASLAVWVIFLVVVPLVLQFYGHQKGTKDSKQCFHFANRMENAGVKVFNYMVISVICVTAFTLMGLQVHILLVLLRKKGQDGLVQQQLNAQMKSLLFILVLMVCFVPYQLFRLYYLEHLHLEEVNELFLTLTALSCVDMLIFLLCWRR